MKGKNRKIRITGEVSDPNVMYLPVVPLRGMVLFPHTITPVMIGRERTIEAVNYASSLDKRVFVVAQRDKMVELPQDGDLYTTGTVGKIVQIMKYPDDRMKVLIEGESRASVVSYNFKKKIITAVVSPYELEKNFDEAKIKAYYEKVVELFRRYLRLTSPLQEFPAELILDEENANIEKNLNVIAATLKVPPSTHQYLLESVSIIEYMEKLIETLIDEINIGKYKQEIDKKVSDLIDKSQKEYFLRQQLEVIKEELGESFDNEEEIEELRKKLKEGNYPEIVRETVEQELKKLSRMHPSSPEAAVCRNYIDWLLELPWNTSTEDNRDIEKAEEILNEDHYGLEKIKKRILEHIAVMALSEKPRGPILCLVGPPGVGKTSIAKSVARALGRKFTRASLGGLHDEAEIRGHRRTYIGALPGKIIQGIRRAGANNPVFLLDEIDKVGTDFRGDPAAALMEVLDPDQNYSFMDNYIEIPFDLSQVMFIMTANTLSGIPAPLLDRMEILRIPGYLENEKLEIARQFLIPKQIELTGLKKRRVEFSENAILKIIREYTREAGVRELERQIAGVLRKVAVEVVKNPRRRVFRITPGAVEKMLGVPPYTDSKIPKKLLPGEALGLAWTPTGGEILRIESSFIPGKGKSKFTGSLGEVMKESIETAISVVLARAEKLGFSPGVLEEKSVHIHFPENAVPKDGPSAGAAIACALVSLFTGRPLPADTAMTGEITLTGRILPVGGLPEKLIAARRYGIKRVFIPDGNKKDLKEIKPEVLEGLEIVPFAEFDSLINVLCKSPN